MPSRHPSPFRRWPVPPDQHALSAPCSCTAAPPLLPSLNATRPAGATRLAGELLARPEGGRPGSVAAPRAAESTLVRGSWRAACGVQRAACGMADWGRDGCCGDVNGRKQAGNGWQRAAPRSCRGGEARQLKAHASTTARMLLPSRSCLFKPHPVRLRVMLFHALLWCTAGLCGSGHSIKHACHYGTAFKDVLLSARPRYVRSGNTCRWPLKSSPGHGI